MESFMQSLFEMKSEMDENQLLQLEKRVQLFFRHNPDCNHPIMEYLVHRKSAEIAREIIKEKQ